MREFISIDLGRENMPNATIIAAPSSTKNADSQRDPEMHQAKQGRQWHFGMKMHTGVDADAGLIQSVACAAANEADVVRAHELLHDQQRHLARLPPTSSAGGLVVEETFAAGSL